MDRPIPGELQEELSNITVTSLPGRSRKIGGGRSDDPRSPYHEPLIEVYANDKNFLYYFFIILYLVVISLSLVLNSYLLRKLEKNWSKVSKKPFFILIFIFCLVNVIEGVADAICNVPVVTFLSSVSKDSQTSEISDYTFTVFYQIFYNLELVGEQMVQWLTLWIAVLRFVIVVMPFLENILFHRVGLALLVGFSLTASCIQVAFMMLYRCYFRYEFMAGYFNFGCYDMNSLDASPIFFGYYLTRIYLPILVFILYLIIFIRIMWLKMNFNTHNLERTVLIQSFIIFITLELAGVLTIYLMTQQIVDRGLVFNTRRILDTADTLAAAVAPVLLLAAGIEHDPKKKKKRRSSLLHQIIRKCFYALPKGAQNKQVEGVACSWRNHLPLTNRGRQQSVVTALRPMDDFRIPPFLRNKTDIDSGNATEPPFDPSFIRGRGLLPDYGDPEEEHWTRSPFIQPQFEMPDNEKGFFYYFFNILSVLVLIFSLLMNGTLLLVILYRIKNLLKRSFFFLLTYFCIVNLVTILCDCVCELPVVTILDTYSTDGKSSEVGWYTFTPFYQFFYHLHLVCEQIVQYLNLLIALLRFAVIVLHVPEEKMANKAALVAAVLLPMAAGVVLVQYMYRFSCYFRYEMVGFFCFGCYDLNSIDAAPVIDWYTANLIYLPIVSFVLYLLIIIKIVLERKFVRSRKMELVVLLQSVMMFASFEVYCLLMTYVFTFPDIDRSIVYNVRRILNISYSMAAGVSPFFILLTSAELKRPKHKKITNFTRPTRPSSSRVSSNINSITAM